jgi:hypothetical protein
MAKPKFTTFTGVKAEEIPAALSSRFPPEAYKGVPGGADLTDINTGFMIERVTSVFGPKGLGWNLLYNASDLVTGGESGRTVTRLSATFLYSLWNEAGERTDCAFPVSGVNQNDFKYADEGARTSAVGAAIKWLCFQNEVYKGQFDHHDADKEKQAAARSNGNVQRPPTQTTTNPPAQAPAAAAPTDNDEIAAANFTGFTKWAELRAQAQGMQIKVETVLEPGKVTKGKVRAAYAELKAKIDAELQHQTA